VSRRSTAASLWSMIEPGERPGFILGIVLAALSGLVELFGIAGLFPFLALLSRPELIHTNAALAFLYRTGGFANDRAFILTFGVGSLAAFIAANAFQFFRQAYLLRYCLRQSQWLSTKLLRHYLLQPYSFFLDHNSGELAKNVISQSDTVANLSLLSWMTVVSESFVLATLILAILWISPKTALAATLLLGVPAGLIQMVLRRRIHVLGRHTDEANAGRFTNGLEALQSIKEIKASDHEVFFWNRFFGPAAEFASSYSRATILQTVPAILVQTLTVTMIMALAIALYARGHDPASIVTLLTAYAVAGYRLMPSLSRFSGAFAQLRQHRHVFDSVMETLASAVPEEIELPDTRPRLSESLEIKGLMFSYPGSRGGRRVLDGVSFLIRPRTFVALAGGSGAGKTTIADILLGLLPADSGQILIDGKPLRPGDFRAWRRRVGYIPQSLLLSDASVAENIAFGISADRIDMNRVREAARLARLDEFVEGLPHGYDTRIGERGSTLSGGQRQRLGIARALYPDPDLLILDESTSALDGIVEREILETLRALKDSKTIIAIAHRPNTIRHCDQVILLEKGVVADAAPYDVLIARNRHFADLMAHDRSVSS
jgi:ABC-type multidrug transport system fused ATPase/permease subunit